ncbi:class I glutamine amidotransferase-like protein [Ceratobasidium sp. AG-I]|nr:class I glutamine amidotransferase-like protein [Ceratobasidium sp. AG-I]
MPPKTYSIAVVLFPLVTYLDVQGPIEQFSFAEPNSYIKLRAGWPAPDCEFELDFVAESRDPITPGGGAKVLASKTFDEVKDRQYDILFVPGGPGTRPGVLSPSVLEFVKQQAAKASYILSVCTGSWVLADAGVLDGKRATTNKASFKACAESTSKAVKWVAKARWVVDGNIWTSSGVAAGADMGHAFMTLLTGEEFANKVKNVVELHSSGPDDDEFAEIHGLI